MRRVLNFKLNLAIYGAALLLAGCGAKPSLKNGSQVSIAFPSAAEMSDTHGRIQSQSTGYDFTLACFAVNISGNDIPSASDGACSIPTSIFQGFVPPGGTMSLSVPNGTARKLDVFAFQRSSSTDSCPTGNSGFHGLNISKIVRVGQIPSFDALSAVVNLEITLTDPGTTASLASQYSLPATCGATVAATSSSARFVCSANDLVSSAGTHLTGHLHSVSVEGHIVGSKYSIKGLTRKTSP